MKRAILCLMVISTMMFIAGCMQLQFHLTINKDQSAQVEYTIGVDESLGFISDTIIREITVELKRNNFETRDYTDNDFSGIKASKRIDNITDMEDEGLVLMLPGFIPQEGTAAGNTGFHETKGFFYNTYSFEGNIDLPRFMDTRWFQLIPAILTESISDKTNIDLILTLPIVPENHNGSYTMDEGRTIVWTINPLIQNHIMLEFKVPNIRNWVVMFFFIMLLITVSFILRNKVKRIA